MPKYKIYSRDLKNIFDFQSPPTTNKIPNLRVPIQPIGEGESYTDFEEVLRIITTKEKDLPGYYFSLEIDYTHYDPNPLIMYSADKPVMVFLHGCISSQRIFKGVCEKLHKSCGNEMVTLDFLGHGKSTKLSELFSKNTLFTADEQKKLIAFFYSPMAMVMQVEALLTILQIRGPNGGSKIHLIGWSLGGYVAYGLANLHPSWVALLISLGAPPVSFTAAGWSGAFTNIMMKTMGQYIRTPTEITLEASRGIASLFGIDDNSEMYKEIIDPDFVSDFRNDVIECDKLARLIVFLNVFKSDLVTQKYLNGETCLKNNSLFMTRLFFGSKDSDINEQYLTALKDKYPATEAHTNPVEVRVTSGARHAVFLHQKAYESLVHTFMLCSILSERLKHRASRKSTDDSSKNTSRPWLLQFVLNNKTPIMAAAAITGVGLWLWSRSKNNKPPLLSNVGEQVGNIIKEGSSKVKLP